VDLALDLVLNEVVEQARAATGATGAAVALFRDGELTCRATAGENAPDLGVRVDVTSSLAGGCVSTGEIQQCRDTETDSRINAEACRRLGVRSMLMAPLVDHNQIIGIIQVFSAWPNAFGKREISALQVLAGRIAENTREAVAGIPPEPPEAPRQEPMASVPLVVAGPEPAPIAATEELPPKVMGEEKPSAFWSLALMVLVIATAVTLGVVIGWRRAADVPSGGRAKTAAAAPAANPRADSTKADSVAPPIPSTKASARASLPPGGLVVTENGRVVYRSTGAEASAQPERPLIHRVEPEYPADAKAQRIQGSVVLDVQVLGTGGVGNVGVISGDPRLTQAAVDAVKQWRYQPDSTNGADSQERVTVRFKLPAS
jgi:TonB family protein